LGNIRAKSCENGPECARCQRIPFDKPPFPGLIPPGISSIMRIFNVLFLGVLLLGTPALAQAPRFVIDDDEYVDKVVDASARLLRDGKLKPVEALRSQVQTKGFSARLAPQAHRQLAP